MESIDQFEKHVAERLKRLRLERGLTLDQLADLSGVSRAMISRIERSEASPTAALLARLCSALGVPPESENLALDRPIKIAEGKPIDALLT